MLRQITSVLELSAFMVNLTKTEIFETLVALSCH